MSSRSSESGIELRKCKKNVTLGARKEETKRVTGPVGRMPRGDMTGGARRGTKEESEGFTSSGFTYSEPGERGNEKKRRKNENGH